MYKNFLKFLFLLPIFLGCTQKPLLVHNQAYLNAGEGYANESVGHCLRKGTTYVERVKAAEPLDLEEETDNIGLTVASVALCVATKGVACVDARDIAGVSDSEKKKITDREALRRIYVERCLRNRNFEIKGWK